MSLDIDLDRQELLDEAIKMLYHSRPAKAAQLLGLVDVPPDIEGIAQDKVSALNNNMVQLGYSNNGGVTPPENLPSTEVEGEKGFGALRDDTSRNSKNKKGIDQLQAPVSDSPEIAKGLTTTASVKRAMSDQELMAYYGSADDLMSPPTASGSDITPTQLAALGATGGSLVAANSMRAKNIAGRRVKGVREAYLSQIADKSLDRRGLKLLNKELRLRGATPTLSLAETAGIAEANMLRAEEGLAKKIVGKRYRGALPLLAASLLGTVAYNKLNEG
jgi:hypothetical protein